MSAWGNIQRKATGVFLWILAWAGIHTHEHIWSFWCIQNHHVERVVVEKMLSLHPDQCDKFLDLLQNDLPFYCGKPEPSFFLKWLSFFQPSKAHVEIDMLAHAKRIAINPELFWLFSHPSPIVPSHQQVWETVFTKRAADTVSGRNPAPPGKNKPCE